MWLKLGAGGQHSTGIHCHEGRGEACLVVGHCLLATEGGDLEVPHEGRTDLHGAGQ